MIVEDCRGLACPAPVIKTKKALESSGGAPVRVVVDNGAPRENVLRFAATRGCRILEEAFEVGWQITLCRPARNRLYSSPGQTVNRQF
jgi:TusA-related sulfurtransferase